VWRLLAFITWLPDPSTGSGLGRCNAAGIFESRASKELRRRKIQSGRLGDVRGEDDFKS
jgi:hypothetical protein